MPKRTDISSIPVMGAGPIIVGLSACWGRFCSDPGVCADDVPNHEAKTECMLPRSRGQGFKVAH